MYSATKNNLKERKERERKKEEKRREEKKRKEKKRNFIVLCGDPMNLSSVIFYPCLPSTSRIPIMGQADTK